MRLLSGFVLTRSLLSLPVRVRNRCLTSTPKDTGVFSLGSQDDHEQPKHRPGRAKCAEFSGDSVTYLHQDCVNQPGGVFDLAEELAPHWTPISNAVLSALGESRT